MSFDPEDPKWTAYMLGELDEDARIAIDRELAESPIAQRFVDELRRTIDMLSTELQAEPCPAMSDEVLVPAGVSDEVLAAADVPEDEAVVRRPLFRTVRPEGHRRMFGRGVVLALAASLLAMVGIASYLVSPNGWHIRDLKLAWNSKPKANEFARQAPPDGEPLDNTPLNDGRMETPLDYFETKETPEEPTELTTDTLVLDTPIVTEPLDVNEADPFVEAGGGMGSADVPFGGGAGFEIKGIGGGKVPASGRLAGRPGPATHQPTTGKQAFPSSSPAASKSGGDKGQGLREDGGFQYDTWSKTYEGEARDPKSSRGESRGGPGAKPSGEPKDKTRGVVPTLGQVEFSHVPFPDDKPIVYPDAKVWEELSRRRMRSAETKDKTAEGFGDVDRGSIAHDAELADRLARRDGTNLELANPMGLAGANHADGDDVSVRYARAASNLARAEYEKALIENEKTKGAIPEAEVDRLKLTWQKSKQQVEEAELAYDEKRRAAEVDRQNSLNDHAAEAYEPVTDNPFLAVNDNPLSTFSIDVDTASYSIVRRYLQQNRQLPPPSAVRIEELVNYFHYDYPQPEGDKPFAANIEMAGCPWNAEHRLVRVGIKGREVARDHRPLSNLVFLIDVSGSMQSPDKLPLVKESMRLLAQQMGENDRVAIVVYAGSSGLVLPSTSGTDKQAILKSLDSLEAGGSTNGAQGIQLAYDIAVANFIKGGVNRVILATDGDFNVGVTDRGALVKLIEQKAASGVFLTTLGYGMGNLKDATLEQLADKGNGNYAYIDNIGEAKKVLVKQMSGTLVTIAKDVKIQVEFNPTQVAAFRLIGYENRILRHEDFNDDKKDAGEIGAGHTVTALYELVPRGKEPVAAAAELPAAVDPLRYQQKLAPTDAARSAEIMTLKLRYKQPDGDKSQLLEYPVKDSGNAYARATGDFKFAASVALFGMLLRDSPYKGTASFAAALELAQEGRGSDAEGYRSEFIELINTAKSLR